MSKPINFSKSLWYNAYGSDPSAYARQYNIIPSTKPLNLAAHRIIEKDVKEIQISKIMCAIGTVLLIIGVATAIVYANSNPISYAERLHVKDMVELGVGLTLIGGILTGFCSYYWYRDIQRLEEAKNKPLVELIDRLKKDLIQVEESQTTDYLERVQLNEDCYAIGQVLIAHCTGKPITEEEK